MSFERISPEEARRKMEEEGYVYLDVRSIPEFDAGHPAGAYNVPLMHRGASGMEPNPSFLNVVQANFPKDSKLIVGCKAGGRSKRAAEQLVQAGYTNVVDQRAGFIGSTDSFGQVVESGWQPKELPTEDAAEPGRSYHDLEGKAQG